MKKDIILLSIERSIRLQYIQEIARPYPNTLSRKIIEKIMKTKKERRKIGRKKIGKQRV